MKTYLVNGVIHTSVDIRVVAENEDEAIAAIIRQIKHVSGSKIQNLIDLHAEAENESEEPTNGN